MPRLAFVPARDSRHRIAIFALYRALLRAATRIELAGDVVHSPSKRHPLASVITARFKAHRHYISRRLVFSAMTAGYNYLSLLTRAQKSGSTERREVEEHIRQHCHPSAVEACLPSKIEAPPKPPPLLENIAGLREPPKFVSKVLPRPSASLKGERKVPLMGHTAHGQPFLRMKKPQPVSLSRRLSRNDEKRATLIDRVKFWEDEGSFWLAVEDQWDHVIRAQMAKEGFEDTESATDAESSFSWIARLNLLWAQWKIETQWLNWVARGKALYSIVEQERALAQQERGGSAVPTISPAANCHETGSRDRDADAYSNVLEAKNLTITARLDSKQDRELKSLSLAPDHLAGSSWHALVQLEQSRMLKEMRIKNQEFALLLPQFLLPQPGMKNGPRRGRHHHRC